MRTRSARPLEVLSISALDLFASALGVFMLVAVILFPFYLKAPSVEAALEGARQETATAQSALALAQRQATDTADRRGQAEARLERALAELAQAEEERAEAETALAAALAAAPPAPAPRPAAAAKPVPRPREGGAATIGDLDLVFVMDTTGSMRQEIRALQRSLLSLIRVLERLTPSLRIGFVAFKDRGDSYLTQTVPLLPMTKANLARMQSFVKQLHAKGGGDKPEPVEVALAAAVNMPWRGDAKGRIVVIGDAPARIRNWPQATASAAGFRSSGSGRDDRRVAAIFTGGSPSGQAFYQRIAGAGGGDFISHRGRMLESILLSVL